VASAKLFQGGEVVRPGLSVEEMVDLEAKEGIGMLLPSGQGQALGLVGVAPPAMQL
jgi:hypothetical protein